MFRKPREPIAQVANEAPLIPSTGRPPTPPFSASQPKLRSSTMASSTTPLTGRSKVVLKNNGRTPTFTSKAKGKSNGSILNFFKKADSNPSSNGFVNEFFDGGESSLFLEESPAKREVEMPAQTPTPPRDYDPPGSPSKHYGQTIFDEEPLRFNEDMGPIKRRRLEGSPARSISSPHIKAEAGPKKGPFIEDSDSDEDMVEKISRSNLPKAQDQGYQLSTIPTSDTGLGERPRDLSSDKSPLVPTLQREDTSTIERDDFEGIEDFIDDEFPEEGEEFLERQWMEEQREFEMGLEEEDLRLNVGENGIVMEDSKGDLQDSEAASCPICSGSFAGLTDQVCSEYPWYGFLSNDSIGDFHPCQRLFRWKGYTTFQNAL